MKFYSLSSRNLKEIYRDPVSLLLGFLMPIALLALFSSLYKNLQVEMFSPLSLTPGIIIFCYSFLIMFSATLLAKDRQSSFLTRLFTTPLKPADYIVSYITPFVPIAFFQAVICLLIGFILGASYSNIAGALLVFILFSLLCISIGVITGSLFTVNQVSGIGSILITVASLFSGAWMDLKAIGGIFESVGYALPFAHAVDVSKALLSGVGFEDISRSLVIILIYTIVLFVLAILSFRWAMKRV